MDNYQNIKMKSSEGIAMLRKFVEREQNFEFLLALMLNLIKFKLKS